MNYATQTTGPAKRFSTAVLSVTVTLGLAGSIIFGMAGGDLSPNTSQMAAHGAAQIVAQR